MDYQFLFLIIIYKAYNGFTDDYDGKRYKSITDDMYTEKITGYIEK